MADKAIFLDRDDTLIEDPGYLSHPDQIKLFNGVPKALIDLKSMGYKLVVVTNQSAIARGIITEKVLSDIHERMTTLLAQKGATIDSLYYCPYHPDGVITQYRKESDERKPSPGMLLKAASEMKLDLKGSWMIGNSSRDVEAGQRAGCRTILIEKPPQKLLLGVKQDKPCKPDYRAVNMKEAVNIVKKHYRLDKKNKKTVAKPTPAVAAQIAPPTPKPAPPAPVKKPAPAPTPEPVQAPEPKPQPQRRASRRKKAPPQKPVPEPVVKKEPKLADTVSMQMDDSPEQTLRDILKELKKIQRDESEGKFSIGILFAGVLQMLVVFCFVMAVGFLIQPERPVDLIIITLAFAAVVQLMSIGFYILFKK